MAHQDAVKRFRACLAGKHAPEPHPFIIPVTEKLTIVESLFDGDPEKDYAIVVSEVAYGDTVITGYVEFMSGLYLWHVVPGFPKLNEDKNIEWRVER